jgi:hypothetical protein
MQRSNSKQSACNCDSAPITTSKRQNEIESIEKTEVDALGNKDTNSRDILLTTFYELCFVRGKKGVKRLRWI